MRKNHLRGNYTGQNYIRQFEGESVPEAVYILESFGNGPYMEYRIPGIVVTEKGTILCCYEGRMDTHNDWARIDIVVCRSVDGGKCFARQVIASSEGTVMTRGAMDQKCPGQKDSVVKLQSQEPVTWNNPVLVQDGELVHLVFHRNYETAYYCFSSDDGLTFSEPMEITAAFREFSFRWNVCASGPGHGIVTKNGRLLIPVWLALGESLDEGGRKKAHNPSVAGAIYSDDRGKTWHAGALVDGIISANETTIAEMNDGRILFNFRNREPDGCRMLGISPDGVHGFEKVWKEPGLPDPGCFGSMIRMKDGRTGFINCANSDVTNSLGERIFLTCYISEDDGDNWTPSVLVDTCGGYGDIATDGDKLYVFYEQSVWNEELKKVNHLILKCFQV